jgi:small ligand-binding sensory domain FIST
VKPFKVAHAFADDWAHAAQACADAITAEVDPGNFGFLYVSDRFGEDLGRILAYLRQRTGVERWVGTVGIGVCADDMEYFDRPAIAAMVGHLPEHSFLLFPAISRGVDDLSADHRDWITRHSPGFGIVHGDPGNPATPTLVADLARLSASFLVGGLTSSRGAHLQVAGRITGGGLSGVLFLPQVAVQTGLAQGCAPIGEAHVISDCVDNILIGLDGQRALDVFRAELGDWPIAEVQQLEGHVHAALQLPGSDTGEFMVRNLIGVDPVHGWIAIGERVDPGDRVVFVRSDTASAKKDLEAMLVGLKRRLGGVPRGGVYFTCVARGPGMFGGTGDELRIIRRSLGPVPLVGFYCNGEISNGRLYGYTGVLALFT